MGRSVRPPSTLAKAASNPAAQITTSQALMSAIAFWMRQRPATPQSSNRTAVQPKYSMVLAASPITAPSAVPAETSATRPVGRFPRVLFHAVRETGS